MSNFTSYLFVCMFSLLCLLLARRFVAKSTNSETVKKLQNQNILFNERNIIKHSRIFLLRAFCSFFVFQLCRLHVLYSCCLNVFVHPKKKRNLGGEYKSKKHKIVRAEELLLLKQIEEAKTSEREREKMFFCHAMPVNSAGISSVAEKENEKRRQKRKRQKYFSGDCLNEQNW